GVFFRSSGNWLLGIVATGLIAVLFDPLRRRLQRHVNRLMYGRRDDPLTALAQLGERLAQAADPETILPTAVQTIAQSLKLPYAAITLEQDGQTQIAAVYPPHLLTPTPAHPLTLPLVYQSQTIGHLLVAQRDNGATFRRRETALLAEMARQTAVAAHTVRLHRELRQTRQQLVTAQAEERRRVSRALGDGLGAQLAALLIQVDSTRQALQTNPDTAVSDIQSLKAGTQTAMQTVRTLVKSLGNR
ncbi:MAG TPA: histidine kinase, partial [Chloroflexota bacterium]|nr:histidine kinase [Chloroflexota bacterium]